MPLGLDRPGSLSHEKLGPFHTISHREPNPSLTDQAPSALSRRIFDSVRVSRLWVQVYRVMVQLKLAAPLWLPAASCAFTENVWLPWLRPK